jgi:hypothetical protein
MEGIALTGEQIDRNAGKTAFAFNVQQIYRSHKLGCKI